MAVVAAASRRRSRERAPSRDRRGGRRIEGLSAVEVFGSPDDMKLRSCATLFANVSPRGSVFERLLERYFGGMPDGETLRLLGFKGKA